MIARLAAGPALLPKLRVAAVIAVRSIAGRSATVTWSRPAAFDLIKTLVRGLQQLFRAVPVLGKGRHANGEA